MTTRRTIHKLTEKAVRNCPEGKRLSDGGGLYLNRKQAGSQTWEYQFDLNGRRRVMGLGGYPKFTLTEARKRRDEAAAQVADGDDPIEARKVERHVAATALTVKQAAEAYLTAQAPRFKTERHCRQMRQRLADFVFPKIGGRLIADIGLAEIEAVLEPIWTSKHRTAARVRQLLQDIISWSIAKKIRANESNPADAKLLKFVLPDIAYRTEHFAALPYEQAPTLFAEIRATDGIKARCLEFIMLTGVRVGDVCGGGREESRPMLWTDIDFDARLWVVPNTKMNHEHHVPLSDGALRVLAEMQRFRGPDDFVFPGAVRGTSIADSTLRYLLYDLGYKGQQSVHGVRSLLKTWAEEVGDYDERIVEAALAHTKQGVVKAYHRGSYLEKRRQLMADWASFLENQAASLGGEVIALRA